MEHKLCAGAEMISLQVVDNSSAFRMQEGIPLVIPEVNPEAVEGIKAGKGGIIANPNCSTIIALMAVTPLHRAAGVKRMVVSTYQVWSPLITSHCTGYSSQAWKFVRFVAPKQEERTFGGSSKSGMSTTENGPPS